MLITSYKYLSLSLFVGGCVYHDVLGLMNERLTPYSVMAWRGNNVLAGWTLPGLHIQAQVLVQQGG